MWSIFENAGGHFFCGNSFWSEWNQSELMQKKNCSFYTLITCWMLTPHLHAVSLKSECFDWKRFFVSQSFQMPHRAFSTSDFCGLLPFQSEAFPVVLPSAIVCFPPSPRTHEVVALLPHDTTTPVNLLTLETLLAVLLARSGVTGLIVAWIGWKLMVRY